jgi:hypothetical protein
VRVRYRAGLRDTAGNPAHAATSIPSREIVLDPELKADPREHERILLHEYLHFAWIRLGNPKRWAWEAQLAGEWRTSVRGEAGWSAEWRKKELTAKDVAARTRRWREYCCESFCDTGAWWMSGVVTENTLRAPARRARGEWFRVQFEGRRWRV